MQTETLGSTSDAIDERLRNPKIAASIARLLDRSEELEEAAATVSEVAKAIPDLTATVADVFDEGCRKASESGIDLEQRFQSLMRIFVKATEPRNVAALETLIDRLPQLEEASQLVDDLPNLLATVFDVLDEYAKSMNEQGIDLEKSLTQGLHAALWLGSRISETELDRLGILLRSDVLDTRALEVIGHAATSLVSCQEQTCAASAPDRVGTLGLIRALRDPDVQKTIGFASRFAKCFGTCVGSSNGKPKSSTE